MWYNDDDKNIDYAKPICCKNDNGDVLLLTPQLAAVGSFRIKGFNWLNTVTGRYQSASFFDTAEQACRSYIKYKPVNCVLICDAPNN